MFNGSHFDQEWQAERKRVQEEKMRKCKRAGFDLEKIEDVEEEMEEEKMLKKKKKKSREMEEGPGRPQQILLGLLWLGAGGVAVMRLLQEQVFYSCLMRVVSHGAASQSGHKVAPNVPKLLY